VQEGGKGRRKIRREGEREEGGGGRRRESYQLFLND